jgi:RNA polymerase primary sigma factor
MGTIWEGADSGPDRVPAGGPPRDRTIEAPVRPESGDWVESQRGSIYWVAREYRHLGVPLEDLLSEGTVGLLEAAARFDPARGVKFASYAIWWIRKRICEIVMRQAGIVRLPRHRLRHLSRIRAAERDATAALGRPPTSEEIASQAGLRTSEVELLLRLSTREISLCALVNADSNLSVEEILPQQNLRSPDDALLREDLRALVSRILSRIPRREAEIVSMRFGLDERPPRTLAEVGRRFGLSRERVRQVESRALRSLRRLAVEERGFGGRTEQASRAVS